MSSTAIAGEGLGGMGFLYDNTAAAVRRIYDLRIEAPPVLDIALYFPDGERFRAAWREIRAEAALIATRLHEVPKFHEIMPEQGAISDNDDLAWRMFILKAYGVESPRNLKVCPTLSRLASSCPDVLSASISFLSPGKHIPPHRGPMRGVLRFYMALSMPMRADGSPAAVLKIAGEEYRLSDGECLLWDDTYEHEVWNDSDEVRSVLLLDVWRRSMPADMKILSTVLIGIVQIGMGLRGFG
jgi:aspartate beta-hydroxylase